MSVALCILSCLPLSADADSGKKLSQSSQPQIKVPAAIVARPATQVSLPIQIGSEESVPRNGFIRVRGLPPLVSLSQGYSIGPGAWAVPLFALSSLGVNVPSAPAGRSEIMITLVTADGTVLAEASTSFVVVAPTPAIIAPPERQPQDSGQLLRPEEKEQARKLVAQGERYLSIGNFPVARQFFERAADMGYAPGALKLAATFDPVELAQFGVRGVVPDLAEARKWYERARELGASEATERLGRLTNN